MYTRLLESKIKLTLEKWKCVTVTGPRQSGKTTLLRTALPEFVYLNLEDPELRLRVKEDPKSVLKEFKDQNIIWDEIQRAPELTSYLQLILDDPKSKSKFILTGSHSLLLVEAVKQSLAGRTRIFELLPLSIAELKWPKNNSLNELLYMGMYPRIHHEKLNPTDWLKDYFKLYVERDVREVLNVLELDLFEKFVRVAAGRIGQLVNYSSMGNEIGVSQPTMTQWLGALKTTYTCFTLLPHFKNFNKRITKSPKLYFYDTGLLCYLLGIQNPKQLENHPLRGNIFENFIVSECYKLKLNQGLEPNYYFWRDQSGNEVDLLEDRSDTLFPIEIKSSTTFTETFLKNIFYLNKLQNLAPEKQQGQIIYTGESSFLHKNIQISNFIDFLS